MSKVAGGRIVANPNPPQATAPGTAKVVTSQNKAGALVKIVRYGVMNVLSPPYLVPLALLATIRK